VAAGASLPGVPKGLKRQREDEEAPGAAASYGYKLPGEGPGLSCAGRLNPTFVSQQLLF